MAEIFFEYAAELTNATWLHEILVAPGLACHYVEGRLGVAGNEDDRYLAAVHELAYSPRGFETVETREAAVHQDQVWPCALRQTDGLFAVSGLDDGVAVHPQHGAKQETRIIVVVRDQDERRVSRVCSDLYVA